ncbi:winged helix-turn-helix transcriptional regulator [Campylobacter jejuni]
MTKENSPCNFEECGFNYTLALINGKYKMSILYCLFRYEIVRYNELKRFLSSISFKTLTNTLRELENDGLIIRKEYAQIPPKVEYNLSKRGQSLIPILQDVQMGRERQKGKKCLN